MIEKSSYEMSHLERNLPSSVEKYISSKKKHMNQLDRENHHLDPKNILKRGFSITQKNNQTLKSLKETETGDTIVTYLYEGHIISTVTNKEDHK